MAWIVALLSFKNALAKTWKSVKETSLAQCLWGDECCRHICLIVAPFKTNTHILYSRPGYIKVSLVSSFMKSMSKLWGPPVFSIESPVHSSNAHEVSYTARQYMHHISSMELMNEEVTMRNIFQEQWVVSGRYCKPCLWPVGLGGYS